MYRNSIKLLLHVLISAVPNEGHHVSVNVKVEIPLSSRRFRRLAFIDLVP